MLIKDEGYMFDIWYYDEKGRSDCWHMFSDNADIYSLQDVPKTAFTIYTRHSNLNTVAEWWAVVDEYHIGDRITVDDAKREIIALNNLQIEDFSDKKLKGKTITALKAFLQNAENNTEDENADKIYINKNIKLTPNSIKNRIKIILPSNNCKIISPSQIVKGRICPSERENDGYNSYIGLE